MSTTTLWMIAGLLFFGDCLLLYFLPTLVARKSKRKAVFGLNLLTGWSLLGWLAAFHWAVSSDAYGTPLLRPIRLRRGGVPKTAEAAPQLVDSARNT